MKTGSKKPTGEFKRWRLDQDGDSKRGNLLCKDSKNVARNKKM
jgi:hypothetical protein